MKIVPDSNIIAAQVLPLSYSEAATRCFEQWIEQDAELIVPALAMYEIVSVLRKSMVVMGLSIAEAERALQALARLELREVAFTPELGARSFYWAEQLGQTVAYDAAFLSVAEAEGAELWTADRKLVVAAKGLGLEWVRYLLDG